MPSPLRLVACCEKSARHGDFPVTRNATSERRAGKLTTMERSERTIADYLISETARIKAALKAALPAARLAALEAAQVAHADAQTALDAARNNVQAMTAARDRQAQEPGHNRYEVPLAHAQSAEAARALAEVQARHAVEQTAVAVARGIAPALAEPMAWQHGISLDLLAALESVLDPMDELRAEMVSNGLPIPPQAEAMPAVLNHLRQMRWLMDRARYAQGIEEQLDAHMNAGMPQ